MNNKVIDELNNILKGEQMAIEAYERYIHSADEDIVKTEFQNIQEDHKRHAKELAEHIRALGGKPEFGTGFTGFMASAKLAVQSMMDNPSIDILKQAYDGEDKGIAMSEEVIKGDLDIESMSLVKRILSEDHVHLRRMNKMIASFEEISGSEEKH